MPYMNRAFAGTKAGEKIEIPSFWEEKTTIAEWRDSAARRGLKFPKK